MSYQTDELLPTDINELPPARQRHIRRQPRLASPAERQILLESLVKQTAPDPSFFLRAFFGALATAGALYSGKLALLIIALVALPFNAPLFGLALSAVTNKGKHASQSLVSLLILVGFLFSAGALAGWLQPEPFIDRLSIYHFSSLYWLILLILSTSTLLIVLFLIRQGQPPQGLATLFSFSHVFPFAIAGFGLTSKQFYLWEGAGLVSLTYLFIAFFLVMFAFLIFGFPPKDKFGWLIGFAVLMLALASASFSFHITQRNTQKYQILYQPTPNAVKTLSPTLTTDQTILVQTPTTKPTLSPTQTVSITPVHTKTNVPTAQPTPFWGTVKSETGALIRESPSFDGKVLSTVNNNDLVEVLGNITSQEGTLWYNVQTKTGVIGWLLGSLLIHASPTP